MIFRLIDLAWLPESPEDFRNRCKAVDAMPERSDALRTLANYRLDINKLSRLARSVDLARREGALAHLHPLRLGLLSNATTDLLVPALIASALRHGIALEVVEAPFDQAMQVAIDSDSIVNRASPDVVLLAFDHRALGLTGLMNKPDAADHSIEKIRRIKDGIHAGCGAPLILQTIPTPPESLFGSLDRYAKESRSAAIDNVNHQLAEICATTDDLLFDVAALARTVGEENWHEPSAWHMAKLAFAQQAVPLYADAFGRLIGAMRGNSRKCLVLDLDNTLWGGVIGDEGLEGIDLGQGTATGESFLAIQQMALDLRHRGILLAVCSKNDETIARQPFQNHPDMLLGEEHIAIFQANWIDKPANLNAIAAALNIDTQALVFLDDNPAERAVVRRELPEVAVPELPDDAALYPRFLLNAGYFETVAFTNDDLARAEQYQANAQRAELQESSTDINGYLASLEMTIHFSSFDAVGRKRISQLINKSNQFNLTTHRYTETQVAEFENSDDVFTLQVRLQDTFGDNGMISVIICRQGEPTIWDIDTWLMSCRVLGREVERAVLCEIVTQARKAGVTGLRGHYIPSGRNELVRDHFAKLGFTLLEEGDVVSLWYLEVNSYQIEPTFMNAVRDYD